MSPNLESKVPQSVGDSGFVLEPTSGLDQESDGGSGLAVVNGSDLHTTGGVDDGSKRACEARRVANGGSRCSQHLVGDRKTKGGYGWGGGQWKSEGPRSWAPVTSTAQNASPSVPALSDESVKTFESSFNA
jgi:hypothetical protein